MDGVRIRINECPTANSINHITVMRRYALNGLGGLPRSLFVGGDHPAPS